MVRRYWARCEVCAENMKKDRFVFVPSCINCHTDNEKFFFHRYCFVAVYNEETKKLDDDIVERFEKIQCRKCGCEQFTIEETHLRSYN